MLRPLWFIKATKETKREETISTEILDTTAQLWYHFLDFSITNFRLLSIGLVTMSSVSCFFCHIPPTCNAYQLPKLDSATHINPPVRWRYNNFHTSCLRPHEQIGEQPHLLTTFDAQHITNGYATCTETEYSPHYHGRCLQHLPTSKIHVPMPNPIIISYTQLMTVPQATPRG